VFSVTGHPLTPVDDPVDVRHRRLGAAGDLLELTRAVGGAGADQDEVSFPAHLHVVVAGDLDHVAGRAGWSVLHVFAPERARVGLGGRGHEGAHRQYGDE